MHGECSADAGAADPVNDPPLREVVQRHAATEDADGILRCRVALLLDVPPGRVRVGRACPHCGSSAHGRPWARLDGSGREVPVSISRSGSHLLTAVWPGGRAGGRGGDGSRIGVDIESVAAIARGGEPALVLHPSERDAVRTDSERAAMWCRKEAILKALGDGLETPMTAIRAADFTVHDLPAPLGFRAALAVV